MIYKAAVSYNLDAAAFANLSGKLTKITGERINQRNHKSYQYADCVIPAATELDSGTLCTKMQKLLYFDNLCKTDESCTVAFCCCVADFCKNCIYFMYLCHISRRKFKLNIDIRGKKISV